MRKNNRGALRAKQLLEEIGYDDLFNTSLESLAAYLGVILIEEPMENADGRIVRGKTKTLIKINQNIPYPEKKRFTLAHEIGHFLLHDKLELHGDTDNHLNWFQQTQAMAQRGIQEYEANDFAAELLMPEKAFRRFCEGKSFSPHLLKELSLHFNTSISSIIFRVYALGIHPVFIVFVYRGIIKYWLKSEDLYVFVKNRKELPPPEDSIAMEYIEGDYAYLYTENEKAQEIERSVWFELRTYERDTTFYEYCIPTKKYQSILSLVWED